MAEALRVEYPDKSLQERECMVNYLVNRDYSHNNKDAFKEAEFVCAISMFMSSTVGIISIIVVILLFLICCIKCIKCICC